MTSKPPRTGARHRHMGQGESVVGAVEIFACAVPEVRADDSERATGFHRCVELGEHRAYRVLAGQVLEEIGDEDSVKIGRRELGVQDVFDDHLNVGVTEFVVIDAIHRPPLRRGDRVDELAAARCRVKYLRRRAHASVEVGGDFLPDRLAALLVDVAEAVLVQPLVVDPHRHRHFPVADPGSVHVARPGS